MSEEPLRNKDELEKEVRAALRSEPRLGPAFHLRALQIEADGAVILDGQVPSVAAKKIALEKVAAIPGVMGIVDRLHVEPATQMSDGEIRVHVRDAMIEEPAFEQLEIRECVGGQFQLTRGVPQGARGTLDIEVQEGIVTLNGAISRSGRPRKTAPT